MKTLISIAALSLTLSGLALADDRYSGRAGDFSWVEPTAGQPYVERTVSRAWFPQPESDEAQDGDLVGIDRANSRPGRRADPSS